jgi:nucleoside-diphosphate-sugar epimerase
VVAELAKLPGERRIIALDRASVSFEDAKEHIEVVKADLLRSDLSPLLDGVGSVVHLAEDRSRRADAEAARTMIERLLEAAAQAGVGHFVLLSSALVYGAHRDNPVPMTESQPLRPSALTHARVKADLEEIATKWAAEHHVGLAVVRPAIALSGGDGSWIGSAVRAAMTVRPEQVDPPVQFVHHDDLARAVALVVDKELTAIYNVAPDGWIGADTFRALRGETEVRLPERAGRIRNQVAKMFADRALLEALEPYIAHPWVVANDRLRAEGWEPAYSNEEAYIEGTTPPLLATLGPQKRQEVALAVAGAAGAAVIGAAAWAARRLLRP